MGEGLFRCGQRHYLRVFAGLDSHAGQADRQGPSEGLQTRWV